MHRILSGKTAWRVHEEARSGLLVDGRDYYLAFYEAARRATRSVLLLGWQFDSDVPLVRGADLPAGASPRDAELLPFLDGLCRTRPGLTVRMLAWDHSVVFAFEREVLQKLVFDVATCPTFRFRWDDAVPLGASQHQKVAIVDGRVAFAGSQDLCHARWDTSAHVAFDAARTTRHGVVYKPYHEVQAVVAGAPARALVDLFVERWRRATGEALDPADLCAPRDDALTLPVTVAMPPARVALSRTRAAFGPREPVHEVRHLYARAIRNAERLVYIETQFLTSWAVRDALLARMRDRARPPLDVVILLPHKPERLKEELTVSAPQAELLATLADEAARHGHALGVYDVAAHDEGGHDVFVYVHSKVMIVDDRFMTIGSANLTNRSMSLDSELNVSWEAVPGDRAVANAIRAARVRLLFEHLGEAASARVTVRPRGLVARLVEVARSRAGRLRRHEAPGEASSALARVVSGFGGA